MELGLKDKVFIVSGGSKGIGEAITRGLVSEGARVAVATRSKEATHHLVEEMNGDDPVILPILGDLRSDGQCRHVIESTLKTFGAIHGVVNNAGLNDGAGLEEGPKAFRESLELNLFHYYDLVHFALEELKKTRGSIINISSKVALTGQGHTSGYAAAKAAQLGLTREWAADLLPYGIRVNAVLPAEVMTPLYQKWLNRSFDDPAEQEATIASRVPLEQRMTTAEEIADTVLFLLSPRSSHTTGQFLIVDGGYVHLDRSLT